MFDITSLNDILKSKTLSVLQEEVLQALKLAPGETMTRELLFKLYSIDGNWESALNQLEIISKLDSEYKKRTELYKNLVMSELMREKVLKGELKAGSLDAQLPEWIETLYQANMALTQGDIEKSENLRIEAFEEAPESAGESDTSGAFSWIADSDGRLGPVCEFICAGGYRWVPFSSIQSLTMNKPDNLLDLLWAPATLQVNDQTYSGYIPARYPLSDDAPQEIKLGHKTEWEQISDSLYIGAGRKVWLTDKDEHSILEVNSLTLF
ncbi:type VI secretion system accessory protein TagJ [Dryocola clanedunensis]|uniref:type VI secretion system accessory protein TagJ n=1 Tax=Cedecea sulfonylureivorans TaxID=3051154 RepID=UPI001926DE25|nr:type VI secretion system accessory protein TagJ [Cedecea sulfonylureivorans]